MVSRVPATQVSRSEGREWFGSNKAGRAQDEHEA